jgi:pyruvate kinase
MRRHRSAKIVATLGPASSTPEMIRALFEAGVDVFRLNFSHGSHEDHRARLETIRAIEAELKRPIGVMADLQGPKLRLGTFAQGRVRVTAGNAFRLDLDMTPGDETRAPLPHPEIFEAIRMGTELLVDDGKVRLRVEKAAPDHAETVVVIGGFLSDRKGVNVPNAVLPISARNVAES